MKKLLSAILILLSLSATVQANPIVVTITGGFSIPESSALLGESLIIAILLSFRGFKFVRSLITWPFITLFTYWCFLLGHFLIGRFYGTVAMEGVVIIVEAWLIMILSRRKFYRNTEEALSKGSALLISTAGNLTSILIGILWGFKI